MKQDEIKKLAVLLDHWIKHNNDHAGEYKKWSEIADREGLKQVAHNLRDAADLMLKSNEKFNAAAKDMPVLTHGEGHDHPHNHDHLHDH